MSDTHAQPAPSYLNVSAKLGLDNLISSSIDDYSYQSDPYDTSSHLPVVGVLPRATGS